LKAMKIGGIITIIFFYHAVFEYQKNTENCGLYPKNNWKFWTFFPSNGNLRCGAACLMEKFTFKLEIKNKMDQPLHILILHCPDYLFVCFSFNFLHGKWPQNDPKENVI
jgi:hypothetical protein